MVDANVLAVAADRGDPNHESCRNLLQEWRSQPTPWYLTWPILFDFMGQVSDPAIYRKPWSIEQAWSFVEAILAAPSLNVLAAGANHRVIIVGILDELPDLRGVLMHETQIVATMLEHGVRRIITRDTEFHRFPMLEVVDPLRAKS